MRIDSCRKCGTELEVESKCEICKSPDQFFCHGCGNITDKQIHFLCNMVHLDYKLLEMN